MLLWWLNGDARITPEREQEHAAMTSSLPLHHQDPFDRLLLAEARLEGLQLITADATLLEYGPVAVRIGLIQHQSRTAFAAALIGVRPVDHHELARPWPRHHRKNSSPASSSSSPRM